MISVIVPVYRTEKYLKRCVNSIINQSYKDLEIILIDDGSDDSSPQLCDELALQDDRIRVIHKENGGLSSSRNAGIEASRGEYIGFVDSDDYIAENMYEILMLELKKESADVAMVLYQEVASDIPHKHKDKYFVQVFNGLEVEKAFLKQKIDSVCVGLYCKSAIGNNRFIKGKTSEDIPFNFQVFQSINRFVRIPVEKYYYYYNPVSISNGPLDDKKLNYLFFREEICTYYKSKKNKECYELSSVLVARAAMGLMTRMTLYGVDKPKNEEKYLKLLKNEFGEHKRLFYVSKDIPFSRKILGLFVFKLYFLTKIIRGLRK